jgi:hypothetical protein
MRTFGCKTLKKKKRSIVKPKTHEPVVVEPLIKVSRENPPPVSPLQLPKPALLSEEEDLAELLKTPESPIDFSPMIMSKEHFAEVSKPISPPKSPVDSPKIMSKEDFAELFKPITFKPRTIDEQKLEVAHMLCEAAQEQLSKAVNQEVRINDLERQIERIRALTKPQLIRQNAYDVNIEHAIEDVSKENKLSDAEHSKLTKLELADVKKKDAKTKPKKRRPRRDNLSKKDSIERLYKGKPSRIN